MMVDVFYEIAYRNESSFLFFYYIYSMLDLEFLWFIKLNKSLLSLMFRLPIFSQLRIVTALKISLYLGLRV